MQPVGKKNHHHFHGLSPEIVVQTLQSVSSPFCVLKTDTNRYTILSIFQIEEKRILVVVEVDNPLENNNKIKINKIITIYPKDRVDAYIKNNIVIYI